MTQTILEKIFRAEDPDNLMDKGTLLDPRIQIFRFLAAHSDRWFNMDQILKGITVDTNKHRAHNLMNVLFNLELVDWDVGNRRYRYRPGPNATSLTNHINLIAAL